MKGSFYLSGSGNSVIKSTKGDLAIEASTNSVNITGENGISLKSANSINSTAQSNSVIKTLGANLDISGGNGLFIGSSGGAVEIDGKNASILKLLLVIYLLRLAQLM